MKRFGIFLLATLLLSSVTFGAVRKWNQKMQELSKVLEAILPEILSAKTGASKNLEKNVKRLTELAHHTKPLEVGQTKSLAPDADPSLAMFSNLFERETKRAYAALKNGSPEYAKMILRTTTTYCISCHTRTDSGPDFPLVSLPKSADKFPAFEKAQWFAATRQFDPALNEFSKVLSDPKIANGRQIEWQRAAKQSLAIAIRIKHDPDRALGLVDSALKAESVPVFFKEQLAAWKASIIGWKAEPAKTLKTDQDFYNELKRLVAAAKAQQRFPADHAADVTYLRASAVGHDLLALDPKGKFAAEAMLWVGTAYEILGDPVLWPLHEMYFEACIRQAPHTAIAGECFSRYETAVYFGYSGSGGVNIPGDAEKLIAELRTLSEEPVKPEGKSEGK